MCWANIIRDNIESFRKIKRKKQLKKLLLKEEKNREVKEHAKICRERKIREDELETRRAEKNNLINEEFNQLDGYIRNLKRKGTTKDIQKEWAEIKSQRISNSGKLARFLLKYQRRIGDFLQNAEGIKGIEVEDLLRNEATEIANRIRERIIAAIDAVKHFDWQLLDQIIMAMDYLARIPQEIVYNNSSETSFGIDKALGITEGLLAQIGNINDEDTLLRAIYNMIRIAHDRNIGGEYVFPGLFNNPAAHIALLMAGFNEGQILHFVKGKALNNMLDKILSRGISLVGR